MTRKFLNIWKIFEYLKNDPTGHLHTWDDTIMEITDFITVFQMLQLKWLNLGIMTLKMSQVSMKYYDTTIVLKIGTNRVEI